MRFRKPERASAAELVAYLEHEVTEAERVRIESELAASAPARRQLQQLRVLREALATPDRALADGDILPWLRTAIAAERDAPRTRWRTLSVCLAACLPLLWVVSDSRMARQSDDEIRVKSAASGASPRPASVHIYRARPALPPEPISGEISARDGLLFAYTNPGRAGFEYLMIFAVDAQREVRWFEPAYVEEGTDPVSVQIEPVAARTLIPDVVEHPLPAGPLSVYALFSARPLHVSEVEAWLARQQFAPADPPLKAASLQRIQLKVQP